MSEHGKYLGELLLVVVLLTLVAGVMVFYIGSALPSGPV